MRNIITSALLVAIAICTEAQFKMVEPVKFTSNFEQTSDSTACISFKCKIDNGWHIYGMNEKNGPTATTINIENKTGCDVAGVLTSDKKASKHYDRAFESEVEYYTDEVTFRQDISLENGAEYEIEGYLEYGACNDENCIPPTAVNFSYKGVAPRRNIATVATTPVSINVVNIDSMKTLASAITSESATTSDLWAPVSYEKPVTESNSTSLLFIFWSCFLGGFFALLTPCVWPIIPMTVSFFLKRTSERSKGIRDSFIYGLSIIVIYLTLGLSITYIAGPNALNAMSTNAIFNIIFTLMLIVFGLSFLGAFEITLPSSWTNAVDSKAEKTTGLLSIFLMAFTLALVSFSCTGPIIGFLLVQVSTSGNFVGPAIGMLGFSLALALPFTLFALFPSLLSKMPKSGSWMMTIKAVLGFVELAFALKFFSVADLAYGWHLMDREVFIVLWASIAIVMGLFLLGKINIAHADTSEEIGVARLVGAICSFAFALYMIPGLWGAPLKAVSAFCPPITTQDFVINDITPKAQFIDFEQGMNAAKAQGKPVLIDFTGHGCVNCRKMEQSVWSDPQVAKEINDNFVLISLYVDDKTPLEEKIELEDGSILRTIGDKWSYLQRTKFSVNAQPFYAPLNGNGELLTQPYAFDVNVDHFISFLKNAKENY